MYWFCHISTWICHRYTRVPHPEPSSLLHPCTIPLGRPSVPAPNIQYRATNLDWRLVSYMILYMFQCHSPKSSHPLPLPQSPKDCSIHQCFFCCLIYRVIVTIFLNSKHICVSILYWCFSFWLACYFYMETYLLHFICRLHCLCARSWFCFESLNLKRWMWNCLFTTDSEFKCKLTQVPF